MNWMFKYFAYRHILLLLFIPTLMCQVTYSAGFNRKNAAEKQFKNISLTKEGNKVIIAWSIAPPQQNVYYEIERAEQQMKFKTVGILFPEEDKNISGKFSFKDKLNGVKKTKTLYYRIKQVNANGKAVYSLIKKVSLSANNENTSGNPHGAYSSVHKYTYCTEINGVKSENNNKVAGILRNTFGFININFK
jgi:hypothetical protein